MYNSTDILKMLNEGKSIDEIAKSFTEALNEAQKKKDEENRAAEAAKAKAAKKLNDVSIILDLIFDFIDEYYPEAKIEEYKEVITPEEILNTIESIIKEFKTTLSVFDKMGFSLEDLAAFDEKCKSSDKCDCKNKKSTTDPIEIFLKKYGL